MLNNEFEMEMKRFDPSLPLAEACTIPSSWYTNPQVYKEECQRTFRNSWQAIGRTDQVASPGEFFTQEIAGEPVVVVRDRDHNLRAFINVCRHRAARVECRSHGKLKHFRCRYHGWAYDLGGKLVGTPDFDGVANFSKEDLSLPEIRVGTWGPLVFVNFAEETISLEEYMRPVTKHKDLERIEGLKFFARQSYEIKCNWKLFVDNYQDGGYHINSLHPDLAKVVNMDDYHTVNEGWSSVQISPLKATKGENLNESLNRTRKGDAAHYWWLFPNFMMNIYDGVLDTNLVLPLAHDRCLCIFDFYFADSESTENKQQSVEIAHQVQLEDIEICEEVQRGLSSQSYSTGRFSVRREEGAYFFHQLLAKSLTGKS
jgi:choline monooxygenase